MDENVPDSSALSIRKMYVDDLPLCRYLVAQAGWNQLDDDWLRAMELDADGCFVAELDNVPVATTTTCCFGSIAWIAMVLVDQNFRNQGIGKQMLHHAISYLESRGMRIIRLDATPLGQVLYQKLGFLPEYEIIRFAGNPVIPHTGLKRLYSVGVGNVKTEDIFELDKQVTGTDREVFINFLIRSNSSPALYKTNDNDEIVGFATSREGKNAVQIGPVIALTEDSGLELLDAAASHFHGKRVYMDVPAQNERAVTWAKANGLTEQRRFIRMSRGEKIHDLPGFIWACSGPEKG